MSEPLGRCECRDIDCAAADDAGEGKHSARDNQCTRDAVRLVTVRERPASDPGTPDGTVAREVPMCSECSKHHEATNATR